MSQNDTTVTPEPHSGNALTVPATPAAFTTINDALVLGDPPPSLLGRRVSVAFGRHREDKEWRNTECALGELVAGQLTRFTRADSKDGMCMLQGEVVPPADAQKAGVQRVAKNMRANHLLLVDYDTGTSLEKIVDAISARGLFAVLWTTWSHLKSRTEIPQQAMLQFMRRRNLSGVVPMEADVLAYLRDDRLMDESVLAGAHYEGTQHVEGGVKYIVRHAPCPRVRALFVLKEPFVFAERGASQKEATDEWKARYAGFCSQLGLPFDAACCDASRLMYVPRIPYDAEVGEGKHEIIVLAGGALDLEAVEIHTKGTKEINPIIASALAAHGVDAEGAGGEPAKFTTQGLLEFARIAGHDFQMSAWLREMGHPLRHDYADGADFECPNYENHTLVDDKDRAFRVWDGSGVRDGRAFGASCRHATCQNASHDDRLWYLDRLCEKYEVKDAMSLITREWCPGVWAEREAAEAERKRQASEANDAMATIDARIEGLTSLSTDEEINDVIASLARRPADEKVQVERRVERIHDQTGIRKKTLDEALKGAQRKEAANSPAGSFDATVERTLRLLAERNVPPTLFVAAYDPHPAMRLNGSPGGRVLEEMTPGMWKAEVNRRVPSPLPHDAELITCVANRAGLPFPRVRGVVSIPRFARDGSLLTTEGYDAVTQDYISPDPNVEIPEVPATVTGDHVQEALWWLLAEALRDVPFSDSFEGGDSTPIYQAEKDADEYPLPNWERGAASRANFLALVLQPFVRNMIHGPCPAYHVDKTTHAEGGTLITHMPSVIYSGGHLQGRGKPTDSDEFQKSLLSVMLTMPPYVLFDNLSGKIESGDLAMAITSQRYAGRQLGFTRDVSCEVVGSFIYTGVGIEFSKELHRRNVPVRIDANMDDPRHRSFKYDFDEFLVNNRGRLIWSCLVLIKNWVQAEAKPGGATLGSFEKWAGVMSGILDAAGVGGFLENMEAYREHALEARNADVALAEALIKTFGWEKFTAAEALDRLLANPDTAGVLEPIGLQVDRNGDASQANKNRFARYIKSNLAKRVHLIGDRKAITKMAIPHQNPSVNDDGEGGLTVKVVLRQPARKSPVEWQFALNSGNPTGSGVVGGVVVGSK